MAKKSPVRVTPTTGNVFRDLGFSKEESERLLVRADLLIQVQKTHAGESWCRIASPCGRSRRPSGYDYSGAPG
jgi:hypothetical protein